MGVVKVYDKIVDEIQQDYYKQNYPNDGQRFVAWYLRNIHLRDRNETKDDITDGADDKQIDAVVIDDEKSTIFIVQGKFIGQSAVDAEPLREVLSSWIQLRDLVRLQEVANNKLKRKLSEVARALEDEYEIAFELITTTELTKAAKEDLATFQKQLAELSERDDIVCSLTIIDADELRRRYDLALERENPSINHSLDLSTTTYMPVTIAGTQVIVASVPLKECIKIPGIKDGTLFQKNVRQSLGLNNTVNKGIRSTIYSDKHRDFFFFHNGITAICNKLEVIGNELKLHGLSVVNGCQSLNTILSCSEQVKKLEDTSVLFRFYEIPQRDRADRISINTNSQSSVKPRDLRSNDKRVLNLKKQFEQKYPVGYFITKRGETASPDRDKNFVLDLSDLGKYLIAWHSQRPNISYSETKIFDKYFEQLFKRGDYKPENAQSLNDWMNGILKVWSKENPLGFNETLLAMKAYAPYHHLYAVSMCFAILSNQSDRVPSPHQAFEKAKQYNMVDEIIKISGISLNMALEAAANEPQPQNRVFSPQNWIKAKTCLAGINFAIRNYFNMLPMIPGGQEIKNRLNQVLVLPVEDFEYRWAAD
ncbi:AIPR protein [Paenibacillus odorifer]|nr:AIPR protein [Paenibacillus odorifer]